MRHPTVSQTSIVFTFGGDLWKVPRDGGLAVRLTSAPGGVAEDPFFSPDGKTIAFTAQYDGELNVYTIPVEGGVPKRLTYDPQPDACGGWTPDGRNVVFLSGVASGTDYPQMYTVPASGGWPKQLPFPSGSEVCYSPDGTRIAYNPSIKWQPAWKRYRGGQTSKIWVGDLSDSKIFELPRKNSNDNHAMWIGHKIFFLSDRTGPVSMWEYDLDSKKTAEVVKNSGFDFKSATAGPDAIAIEQLGKIMLYSPATGKVQDVPITIEGDFPEIRTQFKPFAQNIVDGAISPNGKRAVFEARGEIVSVPASKGDARNLTNSSGAADRSPAWSPDGKSIAYLTDRSGNYQIAVERSDGVGEAKLFNLGDAPGYYYHPAWSPDSTKLVYDDNKNGIWYLDLATGRNVKVDSSPYVDLREHVGASWSPDSKWLTYSRQLPSHMKAVFLYNLESGKSTQVTDGLSNVDSPIFDLNGKYLYFVASTEPKGAAAWLDLSSYSAPNHTGSIWVVVLRNDLPSPLAPQSDEEAVSAPEAPKKEPPFRIDLDGLDQRVLSLPLPPRNYVQLFPSMPGSFLALGYSALPNVFTPPRLSTFRYDTGALTTTPIGGDFEIRDVTPNGAQMLIQQGPMVSIVSTAAPVQPGQGMLNLGSAELKIDPREEWKQIYHEAWRIQRDFFYAPNFHGIDLQAMERKYQPFVAGIVSRNDLNYLFEDMLGELCVGHMFVGGGDIPSAKAISGGMLGADYELSNGRFRFKRVYNGENWNPNLRAPLTAPGVNVKAGEYLLAVNGQSLTDHDNVHEMLENTVGKQVKIKVGPNPTEAGSREVVVVPVATEAPLRYYAWIEDNRRKVDELSHGRVGYAQIPDTNVGGWVNFNRFYYPQTNKEGMLIDERFNHGGEVDDYMVESMTRNLNSFWTSRFGDEFTSPQEANFGPKVLLVNECAGSGGDYFPWHFRQRKVGPIVGARTWGGLVGIGGTPVFVDGGSVQSPGFAFYNPNGTWDVENHGVDPDIPVILDPAAWRLGHDTQLERGVEEVMKQLAKWPKIIHNKPPYMDKSHLPPGG